MPEVPLSADAKVVILETADIGGTNTATLATGNWETWQSMVGFDRIYFKVQIGDTWNAADAVTTCKLQQASDSSGTGAKDLTTSASGGTYDTDNPINAATEFVILEARAEDLDAANSFTHVRGYVAATGNTGTDNVSGVLILHDAQVIAPQQDGAAATGSKVYGNL